VLAEMALQGLEKLKRCRTQEETASCLITNVTYVEYDEKMFMEERKGKIVREHHVDKHGPVYRY
jgi:hypothetical protein